MLKERFLHRLGELVGGRAGCLQLGDESEHLLAEGVLDKRRLVGPVGPEDLAETVSFGLDPALASSSPERGLELGAGQPGCPSRSGAVLRSSWASRRHRPLRQGSNAASADG